MFRHNRHIVLIKQYDNCDKNKPEWRMITNLFLASEKDGRDLVILINTLFRVEKEQFDKNSNSRRPPSRSS